MTRSCVFNLRGFWVSNSVLLYRPRFLRCQFHFCSKKLKNFIGYERSALIALKILTFLIAKNPINFRGVGPRAARSSHPREIIGFTSLLKYETRNPLTRFHCLTGPLKNGMITQPRTGLRSARARWLVAQTVRASARCRLIEMRSVWKRVARYQKCEPE